MAAREPKNSPPNVARKSPSRRLKSAGAKFVDTIKCNNVIDQVLRNANQEISKLFDSDVIFLKAPMMPPIDDAIKDEIEEIKTDKKTKDKLTVILETTGGYVETVERIVNVFRKHYSEVQFVVPNYAYSAGTILVMSGDEIHMSYYSILGPIDPQIATNEGGAPVPGMGYLAKWEELVGQINDPNKKPEEIRAQLGYLISKFDAATLFTIEQSVEHSKSLLKEWLPKYKFKNWLTRETSGTPVTDADRQQRADDIATVLGDAKRWHSHGRGVGIKELESDEIKLKVKNYGDEKALYRNVSHYYGLLVDFMAKNRYTSAVHTRRGLRRLA